MTQTREPESAPASNPVIAPQEQATAPLAELAEPAEAPAATNPHANSPAASQGRLFLPGSSRRAIPPVELIPSHVLLPPYRRDEERNETTDYEKKLRVTA